MYKKKVSLHFIGIGGIGMSGIAQIVAHRGYTVSGCDSCLDQKSIFDLKKVGCLIEQGSSTHGCAIDNVDFIIYSTAIAHSHPELVRARAKKIPIIHRSVMLAEIMRT